ncbi:MAG: hypothetical protein LLF94_12530 [Chlamydiales bacterium]|nr:hypothetical protein [Chlamydiales bacterium]
MKIAPIVSTKSSSASVSTKKLCKKLKSLTDQKIVSLIQKALRAEDGASRDCWKLAGLALNELTIRVWGKTHLEELEFLRRSIISKSKLCVSQCTYGFETAGVLDKKAKKIYHFYPREGVAKKIVKQWHKSEHDISFQNYVTQHVDKSLIDELKTKKVKYLSEKKLLNYAVHFENGLPKINGSHLEDGEYIFVFTKEQGFPMLYAGIKDKGRFQHTSFSLGAPLECAGKFTIVNNKLVHIRLSSGHYHPERWHSLSLANYLKDPKNLGPVGFSKIEIEAHR